MNRNPACTDDMPDAEPDTLDEILSQVSAEAHRLPQPDLLCLIDALTEQLRYAVAKLSSNPATFSAVDAITNGMREWQEKPEAPTWHNPAGLTNEQIGTADGWRLLNEDEICDGPVLEQVQCWLRNSNAWFGYGWEGSDMDNTYRTRLSPEELRKARGLA